MHKQDKTQLGMRMYFPKNGHIAYFKDNNKMWM